MTPRHRRRNRSLAALCEREIARAFYAVGLSPRPRRRRAAGSRTTVRSPRSSSPRSAHPLSAPRYPTLPAWFATLEPGDLVDDLDTSTWPCMADAEDGEQPFPSLPPLDAPPDC